MTALEFEIKALEKGLKIGWKMDFKWVISCDDRKCCLLVSPAAIDFARENSIYTEQDNTGGYLAYFIS